MYSKGRGQVNFNNQGSWQVKISDDIGYCVCMKIRVMKAFLILLRMDLNQPYCKQAAWQEWGYPKEIHVCLSLTVRLLKQITPKKLECLQESHTGKRFKYLGLWEKTFSPGKRFATSQTIIQRSKSKKMMNQWYVEEHPNKNCLTMQSSCFLFTTGFHVRALKMDFVEGVEGRGVTRTFFPHPNVVTLNRLPFSAFCC